MIIAPIPGVIVGIAVQAGAHVTKGHEVCTLETMKMKNIIRAPFDGHLKAILVSAGETVKQKQPLISPLLAQPRMVLLALVTGILN